MWYDVPMEDFGKAAREGSPLPDNLEDAIEEIRRLRIALVRANTSLANMFEKMELVKRSLKGEILHYQQLLGLK